MKALARLRTSSHNLHIEVGRHKNIDRIFRICPYCDLFNVKILENEFHFVMECPLYCDLRGYYIDINLTEHYDMTTFCNLLNSQDEEVLKKLGAFVHKATIRRESIFK